VKTVTVQSIIQNAASRAGLDGSSIDNAADDHQDDHGGQPRPCTCGTPGNFTTGPTSRAPKSAPRKPEWTRTSISTLAQTGSDTEIGDVFAVYQDNPNTHAAPREIHFSLDLDKIRLPSDCPDTVYVKFRLPSPDISPVLATALAQTVPQILADYCKFSLTGDLLTEDGQLDKAQVMYGRAELSLVKETEKFTYQQRQVRRWTANVGPY
jgi:hypothetical protein